MENITSQNQYSNRMSSSHIFHFASASPHSGSDRYKSIKLQSMWQRASDLQMQTLGRPALVSHRTHLCKRREECHICTSFCTDLDKDLPGQAALRVAKVIFSETN